MRNLCVAHVIQSDMRRLDIDNAYGPEASHGSGLDARICVFKHHRRTHLSLQVTGDSDEQIGCRLRFDIDGAVSDHREEVQQIQPLQAFRLAEGDSQLESPLTGVGQKRSYAR